MSGVVACPSCRKELRIDPRGNRALLPCAGCGIVLTVLQTPTGLRLLPPPKAGGDNQRFVGTGTALPPTRPNAGNSTQQPRQPTPDTGDTHRQLSNSVSAIAIVGAMVLILGLVVVSFQWLAGTVGSLGQAAKAPPVEAAPDPDAAPDQAQTRTAPPAPASRDRTPLRTRELIELVEPSVCSIKTPNSVGTGFVVGPNLICTNEHVLGLEEESEWELEFANRRGRHFRQVELAYVAVGVDMVLLRVPDLPKELRPLIPISKSELRKGDRLVVIGNPGGLENVVTEGIVGSFQEMRSQTYIQLSVAVNPGNSGGPALNEFGEVAGVVTLKAQQEGIGMAIPGDAVQRALKELQGMSAAQSQNLAERWKAGQAGAKLLEAANEGLLLVAYFAIEPDDAADNVESWQKAYQNALAMSKRVRDTLKDGEREKLFIELEGLFSETVAAVKQAEQDPEAAFRKCRPLAKRGKQLRREIDSNYGVFDTRQLKEFNFELEN